MNEKKFMEMFDSLKEEERDKKFMEMFYLLPKEKKSDYFKKLATNNNNRYKEIRCFILIDQGSEGTMIVHTEGGRFRQVNQPFNSVCDRIKSHPNEDDLLINMLIKQKETITMNDTKEKPLSVKVENGLLSITIGINRLNGNSHHPEIPELKIENTEQWANDVADSMTHEISEAGETPLNKMIDSCMIHALEQGSSGIAEDSPEYIGRCSKCDEDQEPIIHIYEPLCVKCYKQINKQTKEQL